MRLGGSVCFGHISEFEEKLVSSRFRAVTAPFNCETPRAEREQYLEILRRHDVLVAEAGVWRNPFDREKGEANLDYAVRQLRMADELGIPCCVNIVGTTSPAGWDAADPENYTEEMYARIIDSIRRIIDGANPHRACYCIEPMPWMVPDGPEEYLQLIRDVDRKQFAVHMDFVNMINSPRRYLAAENFIKECFSKLGPHITSTHLKDTRMNLTQLTTVLRECSPGEGSLDFVKVLKILDRYLSPDAPVLLEHMQTFEEYRVAYDYVAEKAKEAGVAI